MIDELELLGRRMVRHCLRQTAAHCAGQYAAMLLCSECQLYPAREKDRFARLVVVHFSRPDI